MALTLTGAGGAVDAPPVDVGTAGQRAMLGIGGNNVSYANATAYYLPVGGMGAGSANTQALADTVWRGSGKFANLRVRVQQNSRSVACTVSVLVNGVARLTCTIGAGSTTVTPDATVYDVAAYDTVCVKVDPGSGSGNIRLGAITWEFKTASGTQVFAHYNSSGDNYLSSGRYAYSPGGFLDPLGASTSSDVGAEAIAIEAFTLSNIVAGITSGASPAITMVSRKNNAAGNQTIAATTGTPVEDTTNSDSLSAGNTFVIRTTTIPGTNPTYTRIGFKYTGAVAGRTMVFSAGRSTVTNAQTAGVYGGPFGPPIVNVLPEYAEAEVPFACQVSDIAANVQSYAGANQVTLELYKNTGSGPVATGLMLQFTTAGIKTTSSGGPVTFAAGDKMCWKASGQNGDVVFVFIGVLVTDTNAA